MGYVVKCNRVIALNPYVGKKHVKYTIHRDRLALSKTDNTVEVVDINNSWFGYDLSKHTTTTTNLVYEKMIDNNSTEDSTTLDLSGISGIISGIEHNVDMPLKVGLPSWEDDKQDTVTLVSDNTFNLANTTKNKIAIRVDENTILECIRVESSYKIVEINGRRYTSINPSNHLVNEGSYLVQDVTEYYSIIRFEKNNGLDLCMEVGIYTNLHLDTSVNRYDIDNAILLWIYADSR